MVSKALIVGSSSFHALTASAGGGRLRSVACRVDGTTNGTAKAIVLYRAISP